MDPSLMDVRPYVWEKPATLFPFFFCYLFLSFFGVVNVAFAEITVNAHQRAKRDEEALEKRQELNREDKVKGLKELCRQSDKNHDQRISLEEFDADFRYPSGAETLGPATTQRTQHLASMGLTQDDMESIRNFLFVYQEVKSVTFDDLCNEVLIMMDKKKLYKKDMLIMMEKLMERCHRLSCQVNEMHKSLANKVEQLPEDRKREVANEVGAIVREMMQEMKEEMRQQMAKHAAAMMTMSNENNHPHLRNNHGAAVAPMKEQQMMLQQNNNNLQGAGGCGGCLGASGQVVDVDQDLIEVRHPDPD